MPETASGELETDILFSSVPTIVLTSTLAPLSFHEISSAQTHTHPRCSNYLYILSSNACISVYVCICLNSGCLSHYILSHSTVSHLSKFNRKTSLGHSFLYFSSQIVRFAICFLRFPSTPFSLYFIREIVPTFTIYTDWTKRSCFYK